MQIFFKLQYQYHSLLEMHSLTEPSIYTFSPQAVFRTECNDGTANSSWHS